MAAKSIVGILLVILGLAGLLYGGFSYTHDKKVVDLGPVEVTKQQHERIPISPIVGGLILVSGIWLLSTSRGQRA